MAAVGAGADFTGIKLPLVEAVLFSFGRVIGSLLMGAVRLTLAWALVRTGVSALFASAPMRPKSPVMGIDGNKLQLQVGKGLPAVAAAALIAH